MVIKVCEMPENAVRIPRAGLHNVSYATLLLVAALLLPAPHSLVLASPEPRWGYLPNGAGYLVIPSHATPLVGSVALIHSGSGSESWSTQGASHFLEHLLFNGTERRTQEEIYESLDRLGTYHNATTRETHVAHFVLAPRTDFWQALDVQRDMVFHSTLAPEKVEKERGIILQELAKDQDAGMGGLESVLALDVFGPRGYGLPTIGTSETIRRITREEVAGFYERGYSASNVTWVLLGDLDPDAAVDSLIETVGSEASRATPAEPPPGPDTSGPSYRHHVLPEAEPTVQLVWVGPDPSSQNFNAFRARMDLLCDGDGSSLGKRLPALLGGDLVGYSGCVVEYPGFSLVRIRLTLLSAEVAERIPSLVSATLREAAEEVPGAGDLDRWRARQEADEIFLREKPHYYGILRGERLAARGLPATAGYLDLVAAVDLPALLSVPPLLDTPPLRVSIVVPPGEVRAGSAAEQTGRIEGWTCANGAEVLSLSSPENEVFALHLFVRGRSAREPEGKAGIAELVQGAIADGPADMTPDAFAMELDRLGIELKTADDPNIPYDDSYSLPAFGFVRFQTLDRNAEAGLDLLRRCLEAPRLDDTTLGRLREGLLQRADRAAKSGREAQRRLAGRALFGRDAGVFGTRGTVASIQPNEIRDFASGYLDPRSFLIVVASGLPEETLRGLIDRNLGRIPAGRGPAPVDPLPPISPDGGKGPLATVVGLDPGPVRRALAPLVARPGAAACCRDLIAAVRAVHDSLDVHADSVGSAQAGLGLAIPWRGALDLPAATVANAILSERIAFQLREREGLAYSIGSSLGGGTEGAWYWGATAGTSVQAVPRIIEGFLAAIDSLAATPPSPDEASRAIGRLRGSSLMRRATRMNWAYYAGLSRLAGLDPELLTEREDRLREVSPEEISRVVEEGISRASGAVVTIGR